MKTGKEHSLGRQPAVRESGTVATGDPANNVMTPHSADPATDGGEHGAGADAGQAPGGLLRGTNTVHRNGVPGDASASKRGHEAGTRGSGMPVTSGAGQLADDRPGRDAPKGQQY
ncbi:hypothetical protein [Pseudoduganella ginsengisoli]|uniref:Uncharacterized protein n=1 Tax=Pseudoduganella ginsengisoli TaxID=1462440 RepID=A0A6L6PX72_9BURK|nr:hypothetical protein [Pseudoduganella ginsengisoli]MTW01568.1 hypothetical protein [Pseudoduganella ginsengisoli]